MNMLDKTAMMMWVRRIAAYGLLAYLASFFFLGPTSQKTLFYLVVAAPSIILFADFRRLLQEEQRISVLVALIFLAYFSSSALWSVDGRVANGLKLALCIICLMLAVHSTMSMRNDSGTLVRHFILIVGACAVCAYLFMIAGKTLGASGYSAMVSERLSLRALSGWGDNNPINSAMYIGLVPLAAWWSFDKSRPLAKIGLLFLIASGMAIMFLTKSRGPLLSLTVTLFLISALRRNKDDLILWGVIVSSSIAAVLSFDLIPLIVDRATSPNYRLGIWMNAIELIKQNLFFGQGLGDSADIALSIDNSDVVIVSHSHSSILETFRVGGIVGGLLFLAMLVSITCRLPEKNSERCFFVFWLVFGLLCLSTNGRIPLIRPSIEWFAFWVPLFFVVFCPAKACNNAQTRCS